MASHFVKLYGDILRSSVWAESPATRLLWITMLADADETGFVRGDIRALARLANLSAEEVGAALAVLTAPDPASQSSEEEGRRVLVVKTGLWRVVNYVAYRELRTTKQQAAAERQRRWRDRRDGSVTGVTERDASQMSHEVSTSTSSSSTYQEQEQEQEPIPKQEPARKEGKPAKPIDALVGVLVEAGLDLAGFEPTDRAVIEGALRASCAPLARAVVLANALKAYPPGVVGRAFREYMASEQPWSSRLFGGFVRDAAKQGQVDANRQRSTREATHIDREAIETENARREEAEIAELLADFERTHGDEFARLSEIAEASVDRRVKGAFRAPMVRAALVKLIRGTKS